MDQAHIRGLVTGIASLVAGLPRSWLGDHTVVPTKNFEDSPHRARRRVTDHYRKKVIDGWAVSLAGVCGIALAVCEK